MIFKHNCSREISLPLSLKKITVFNLKGEKKITSLVDVNEEIGVEKQKKIAENQETMVFVEEVRLFYLSRLYLIIHFLRNTPKNLHHS